MFEIGWSELLLIAVVALIAIGPKELPTVLRTLGQWMSKLRRMASEFQSQFQEVMREAEMVDLKKQADEMTSQAQSYANFDPVSEVRRELESTQQQIESAMVDKAGVEAPSPPVTAEPNTSPARAEPAVAPSTDVAASSSSPKPATAGADAAKPDGKSAEPRGRREGDRGPSNVMKSLRLTDRDHATAGPLKLVLERRE